MNRRTSILPNGQRETPTSLRERRESSRQVILGRVLPRVLVRLLIPLIIYGVVDRFFAVSEWVKLGIVATPLLVLVTISWLRRRRVDGLSALLWSGILLSMLPTLFTSGVRLLELRVACIEGVLGLLCLGSLVFRQPLLHAIYQRSVAMGNSKQWGGISDAVWTEPFLLPTFRMVTSVVGCGLAIVTIAEVFLMFFLVAPVFQTIVLLTAFGADILLGWWAFRAIVSALGQLPVQAPSLLTTTHDRNCDEMNIVCDA